MKRRALSLLATLLSVVAVGSLSTASLLYVYEGEVPEELL
jgi:cyclic lactone autoinducer peptide